MNQNMNELPVNLPRPIDDGGANHLKNYVIPKIKLQSTNSDLVDLSEEFQKPTVLFIYPKAGSPLESNTNQDLWDSIPGARGCTPQSCGYRDLNEEFNSHGIQLYGLSIQSPIVQREFVERNHLTFPILSDEEYKLTDELNLPTFEFEGERLIKRMAFFIKDGRIKKVFYPVFPPDKNAEEVLGWLKGNI